MSFWDVAGSLISGFFGSKASGEQADAYSGMAAAQIASAEKMQDKELEAMREALQMMKDSETQSVNIMVDSLINEFRMGKDDYLSQQKAKAGLNALTYGKPAEYISNIWTTNQDLNQIAKQPAETISERTEIAPTREEVTTTTAAEAVPKGKDYGQQVSGLIRKFDRMKDETAYSDYTKTGVETKAKEPTVTALYDEATKEYTLGGEVVSEQFLKDVGILDDFEDLKAGGIYGGGRVVGKGKNYTKSDIIKKLEGYMSTTPETGEVTPGTTTTTATADEISRAEARKAEGYKGSVIPAVETERAEIDPESLVSEVYDSPMYKRRIYELNEGMRGLMGRDLESSAGRKLFAREVDTIGLGEENRLWGKLSQLAGYGSYLPEAVGTTGSNVAQTVYGSGQSGAQTIMSGAKSASAIGRWGQTQAAQYTGAAAEAEADATRGWGSAINYGIENIMRSNLYNTMLKKEPAGG